MKKRLKWIFLGIFSVAIISVLICIITFMSKTIHPRNIEQYCIENTDIDAVSFTSTRESEGALEDWTEYVFWVSEGGLSDRQELFIFQKVQFGPFRSSVEWDRFCLAYHTSGGADEIVSSVMFSPRDTRNRKLLTNWMVFYSSNQYRVSRCSFTVEEDGQTRVISGKGVVRGTAFVAVLPDLGEKDGISRKFIKAEFFDEDGNLVETIVEN